MRPVFKKQNERVRRKKGKGRKERGRRENRRRRMKGKRRGNMKEKKSRRERKRKEEGNTLSSGYRYIGIPDIYNILYIYDMYTHIDR